jgi:hypothetical protein
MSTVPVSGPVSMTRDFLGGWGRLSTFNLQPSTSLLIVVIALTALVGCGRKDDPQPPVIRRADTTRDLEVYQDSREVVLRWSYPSITTAGGPLPDVEEVEVWRAPIPFGQEPIGSSARERTMRNQLLTAQGEMLASLDSGALAEATRGAMLEFRDDLDAWWSLHGDEQPVVMWYAVRTICCKKKPSEFSNIARLVPATPPEPFEGLGALTASEGIHLNWAPQGGMTAIVERSVDGEEWQALTAEALTGTHYLDDGVEQNRQWQYRIRAVRSTDGGGRVLGAPSAAIVADYPDVYPPKTPANLVCLPEADRVEVRWEGEPDAQWYRVERRVGAREWLLLVERHEETSFEDTSPPLGDLSYAVRAADEAGNISERAICTTVIGPEE